MKSFELVSEDEYEKIFVSKKHGLKIVKTNSRAKIVELGSGVIKCEFINADDKTINDKIKEMIKEI